jgi:hypothetical protein
MIMANKFEMIEVHPVYAKNRLAANLSDKLNEDMKVTFHQVDSVESEKFKVKLSSEPSKTYKFDDCTFLSKVFKLELKHLSA